MGTSALTIIKDENNCTVLRAYNHFDGYPASHGAMLADWLRGYKITNGISSSDKDHPKLANGIGSLAAQLVAHLLTISSSVRLLSQFDGSYVFPDDDYETVYDFAYVLSFPDVFLDGDIEGKVEVRVYKENKRVFMGNYEEFVEFVLT